MMGEWHEVVTYISSHIGIGRAVSVAWVSLAIVLNVSERNSYPEAFGMELSLVCDVDPEHP